jgi:hypothetical protein
MPEFIIDDFKERMQSPAQRKGMPTARAYFLPLLLQRDTE